jgi:hypothetical protein
MTKGKAVLQCAFDGWLREHTHAVRSFSPSKSRGEQPTVNAALNALVRENVEAI